MFWKLCAIALFCLILSGPLATHPSHAEAFGQSFVPTNPSQPMPAFMFQDQHGQSVSLKNFQGRFVVLNLWATWCAPCVHEMPSLDELQRKFGSYDFTVITINEDHDGLTTASSFFNRHNIKSLSIFVDNSGHVPSLLRAGGLPTTILIDNRGFEIGRILGEEDWSSPDALAFLKSKMSGSASSPMSESY